MNNASIKIGFFGTPEYAATTLEYLKNAGFEIRFVVTNPDRPKGRGMKLTASPAKVWAEKNKVPVLQPELLRSNTQFIEKLKSFDCDVFVVIAYGKIIPEEILNIPPHKSLNIHGSLLPKLRGASPIETSILNDDKDAGVTIIRMDAEMDHGPIVASQEVIVAPWPPTANELGSAIVESGASLMIKILPDWIAGKLPEIEQDHPKATFTKKITKLDGLIDLNGDPYKNFLKIQAYNEWPTAYFYTEKIKRLKITSATFKDGKLIIEKVIPEGGKETDFSKLPQMQTIKLSHQS